MRKLIYRTLLALNILFAAAILLSYLAVLVSPEIFALPAFFGLAYPYLLLVNILFVIFWTVLFKYEAFISLFVILLGITHLANYIRIGRHEGNKEGTIKVMSYNVRLFNYFENPRAGSEKQILAFLRDQKPDIICLQEFFMNGDRDQKDQAFRRALGNNYYSHMKLTGNARNGYYGIVTYSRYPVAGKGHVVHPASSSLSIYTDVVIGIDTFRIFNNHLQSFRLKRMERSFLEEMTDPADNATFESMKNLSVSLRQGFAKRARQADALKSQINNSPYPVIVAGDFNDTPVSYSYRKIRKGLNDSFLKSGKGAGFTYRGQYPSNRIDYILNDKSLVNSYFEIIKVKYSDHYPVAAYFRKPG